MVIHHLKYNSDEKCLSIFGSKFPNIHLDRLSILDVAGTLQDENGLYQVSYDSVMS